MKIKQTVDDGTMLLLLMMMICPHGPFSALASAASAVASAVTGKSPATAAAAAAAKPKMAKVYVEGAAKPLEAHVVLCTLPLGVLQHGDVKFSPPLPEYKRKAIAALGMGTENRVAMLFDPSKAPFWPTDAHFLRPVHGRYTFANLHALGLTGVLCAWVRAKHIEEVEAMSDEEAYEDVMKTLRTMFPETAEEPREYKVTRWSKDPFSRGSYSYVPAGYSLVSRGGEGGESRHNEEAANQHSPSPRHLTAGISAHLGRYAWRRWGLKGVGRGGGWGWPAAHRSGVIWKRYSGSVSVYRCAVWSSVTGVPT